MIKNINVTSCGDKGLSVGEKSNLKSENISIFNSTIGIASKDGSKSNISNINIENVDTCLSAYNKKQEFNGGKIKINKFNCLNFNKKTFTDSQSKIIFNSY